MARYWTNAAKRVDSSIAMFGCYIFDGQRTMAVAQAFGRDEAEAQHQAQCIIAALMAVEERPAVAAKARHYLVRSPKVTKELQEAQQAASVMQAVIGEGVPIEVERAYDEYFTACEKANRVPLSFEEWREVNRE